MTNYGQPGSELCHYMQLAHVYAVYYSCLPFLSSLFMLCCSEWKRLLFGGSWLPSEQLKLSSSSFHSSSPPFTAGLPHPPPPSDDSPLGFIRQTLAHTCACQRVHGKIQTHWTDRGRWGCAFYATTLSTNSECVCVWDSGGDWGHSCSRHSHCVV